MKKYRLNGNTGPVCFDLEPNEPFPDVSTADSTYLFVKRGDREFQVSFDTVTIREINRGRHLFGLVGTIRPDGNRGWFGMVGNAEPDQFTPERDWVASRPDFSAAVEALIEQSGSVLDEDLQTLRRLADKYQIPLPTGFAQKPQPAGDFTRNPSPV